VYNTIRAVSAISGTAAASREHLTIHGEFTMAFAQEAQASTMQTVQFPLTLNFKILALSPQIFVRDAGGRELMYVHQKMFKLKEDINVYSNSSKSQVLFTIKADRIIDFSANYSFTDANGNRLGSIKREGMRSILKASYNVMDESGQVVAHLKEDNAWIKVIDALLGEVPVLGMFTGYFFNPSYTLYRGTGLDSPALHIKKEPAFMEGKFTVTPGTAQANSAEQTRALLATMMMLLLERSRG
jgi:uncharacterized protein YxjI